MSYEYTENIKLKFGCPKPGKKLLGKIDEGFRKFGWYTDEGCGMKRVRNIKTTCCGTEMDLPCLARTITPEHIEAVQGRHNDMVRCPNCGTEIQTKNAKKIKNFRAFDQYLPVVMLTRKKNVLYAIGAWAYRSSSAARTSYKITSVYSFQNGKAKQYERRYYGQWYTTEIDRNWSANKPSITEPLYQNGWTHNKAPYWVYGAECVKGTDLKYIPIYPEELACETSLIRLLAMASIYPQIEMLRKLGHDEVVADLVYRQKKNSQVVDWNANTIYDFFRLSKAEYKAWMMWGKTKSGYERFETLKIWKRLKRTGFDVSFDLAEKAFSLTRGFDPREFTEDYRGIGPAGLIKYLEKQKGDRPERLQRFWRMWRDYISQAEELGRDMQVHNVRFPRDLMRAHDEIIEEYQIYKERLLRKRLRKRNKEEKELVKKREARYNFEYGGMFIRVAKTALEVTKEGEALKHCVAGYAQRHMAGKTTILFLRRTERPNDPLYTVEMDGKTLMQAHGYRNDLDGGLSPQKACPLFFEVWLDWVAKGSKRDKAGNPIIPKKFRKEIA